MTLAQSIEELLRRGCSVHIGAGEDFMGLASSGKGTVVVVDGPTGKHAKEFNSIGSGYSVGHEITRGLNSLLSSGALPVAKNDWEAH
jgi:hypothetical protein